MKLHHIFNGSGDSEVHKAGCSHLKKFRDDGFDFEAETKIDAVLFIYEGQIYEAVEEYGGTIEEEAQGYIDGRNVAFAPCVTIK